MSRQHARRALVNASVPLRRLPLPIAQPLGDQLNERNVIYRSRDAGTFKALPADFGETMPPREYDLEGIVLEIPDSKCTFRNMHALDSDRRVLYQREYPFGNLPVALQRLEKPTKTYDSVAYLSNTWVTNYYHWLMLVLPFVRYYGAAEVEIEKVYVGAPLNEWQTRTFDYLGLTPDMVVTEPCVARTGHVAVLTRHVGGVSAEIIRWAREVFVRDEPPSGTRRLFVGRGEAKTRKMIDENLLADALQREFDFEYVITSDLSLDEEIEVFGEAQAVVAPLGAALTNILFAPSGTSVLELAAYDNDFRLAYGYQEMSAALGHRLGTIRGLPTPRRKDGAHSDIRVDVDEVLRATEKMLSGL